MPTAVVLITEQVRERVRRDGVDLGGHRTPGAAVDRAIVDQYVREEVRRYSERALGGSLPMLLDEHQAAREIVASITGFGVLQPFFDDPDIEEIWINGPSRVFIARDGVPELTSVLLTDTEVRDLVERMLQSTGRRVDLSSPFVDASLPDVRGCTS
jgi:pilus assembly protein CpaF